MEPLEQPIPSYSSGDQIPFRGTRLYRLGRRLPRSIKALLLSLYWPLKGLLEDLQEYSAELVGHIPLHALRLWWFRHFCRTKIGTHSSIHRHCRMYHPHKIRIGESTVVNYGVLLDGRCGLSIGDNVSISESSVILTQGHDIDDPYFALNGGQVTIGDYVFVGTRALILPGVTIGAGAVVAAGAVVTRNVDPYTVVGGVPARPIRRRSSNLAYQLQHRKRFG